MRLILGIALALPALAAEPFTVYVGELGARSALLAWGRKDGTGNRIGRAAAGYGPARLRIGERMAATDRAWARVEDLQPDTEYDWALEIGGAQAARGRLRTWAERADRLAFLVIGDFGTGSSSQRRLARRMAQLVEERAAGPDPVRFVLSTGDNINAPLAGKIPWNSGDSDGDWWPTFFEPYGGILRRIPFYSVLGNHDGNESERRGDLFAWLDNFFFPGGEARRWYTFEYGGLAQFFALDSSSNTAQGPPKPAYDPAGPQTAWLKEALAGARARWRIAYLHHPPFNAGPRHQLERYDQRLRHWLELFARHGVKMAFEGHEHNFQASKVNQRSLGIRHFITGSGGSLRTGDARAGMEEYNVETWVPKHQFLLVEIAGGEAAVTSLGEDGKPVAPPFLVR